MVKRSFGLSPVLENSKDKGTIKVERFEIDDIIFHFKESMSEITKQLEISNNLRDDGDCIGADNILRSQVVLIESAFDFFVHEIIKYGLQMIFEGMWEETEKYDNLNVRMVVVQDALRDNGCNEWFLEYVNEYYSEYTLTSYASVKNVCNILGLDVNAVAKVAFNTFGSSQKPIDIMKSVLDSLYNRRNIIAHQSDREHANASKRTITEDEVRKFFNEISVIVEAICKVVRENN